MLHMVWGAAQSMAAPNQGQKGGRRMNGRVAKRIRREVYGVENSPRVRRYKANVRQEDSIVDGVKKRIFKSMTVFDAGLRAAYQKAKREYRREGVEGK